MQKVAANFVGGVLSKGHLFRPSVTLWSFSGLDSLRTFTFPQRLFSGSAPDSGAPDSGSGSAPDSGAPDSGFFTRPRPPHHNHDWDWDLPKTASEDTDFYHKCLRQPLVDKCYANMREPQTQSEKNRVFFVTIPEIVSAAIRYPPCFRSQFFNQILASMIIVQDPDESIYPYWFDRTTPLSLLRNPIQILSPILAPPNFEIIYCDASPSSNPQLLGAGGMIRFHLTGEISCFGVVLGPDSSYVTEGKAVDAMLKFLAKEKVKKIIVICDNLDFIDAMSGNRDIRPEYAELYRCFFCSTALFEHCVFQHAPRELLSGPDAIAYEIKKSAFKFGKVGEVRPLNVSLLMDKTRYHIDRHRMGIPVIRLERLPVKADGTIMVEKRRWSPHWVDPYYLKNSPLKS